MGPDTSAPYSTRIGLFLDMNYMNKAIISCVGGYEIFRLINVFCRNFVCDWCDVLHFLFL